MDKLERIRDYILYLKKECGLYVTLHPVANESLITLSELLPFNIHDNPYCVYVKSFDAAYRHCIERQPKVVDKCKGGSFCGCCYAGVREYIYPITDGTSILGFVSVGGYRAEQPGSYIQATANTYNIPPEALSEMYANLDPQMPAKKSIDTLILPLCDMLELAYIKSGGADGLNEELIDRIIRYIKQHHTVNSTMERICEKFFCSRSYLSHNFNRKIGKSFREYLVEIRLSDAKSLLKYSRLSITEIALAVGFCDATYFANVFKEKIGVSPSLYRKQ